jgi:transcription initiation factor IIF auxiliary subunit
VATHPFEVTEKGWGEFEALVDLYFKDAHEKSVELRHFVKLFHGNSATAQPNNKKVREGGREGGKEGRVGRHNLKVWSYFS